VREKVSYIHIEISPMQLVHNIVFYTKVGHHCLVHLSCRYRGKMHICRKTSCRMSWKITLFIIVFEFSYMVQYLQSILPSTMHSYIIIGIEKLAHLLRFNSKFNIAKSWPNLKMLWQK
jgi:hypothetical protein